MKRLLLSLLLSISGCSSTPTTQIVEFADSVSTITYRVDGVIQEYNNTVLDTQFTNYASSYKDKQASLFSSKELAKIKKPITDKSYKSFAIARANKALADYANSLSELSMAGSRLDIDLAAGNLYGSLININDQYKIIKETEDELFDQENLANVSKVIAAVGGLIVEEKRRSAIKDIVIMANNKIAVICDEINSELKIAGMGDSIGASRQYILTEEIKEYKRLAKEPSRLSWRREEMKRLYSLQQDVFNSKLLVQQTQKAILAVKESHNILANQFNNNKFSSAAISKAIGRLKALNKNYKNYDTLIMNCKDLVTNDKGMISCNDT